MKYFDLELNETFIIKLILFFSFIILSNSYYGKGIHSKSNFSHIISIFASYC